MKQKNFIPVLFIVILVIGCSDLFITSPDDSFNVMDFEAAWNAVNNVYPLLEYKKIDWNEVYNRYCEKVFNSTEDFSKILFDMMRELKDPHVILSNKGMGLIIPYPGIRLQRDFDAFSPILVRKYFDKGLKYACREKVEYEILQENIGYIRIATFNGEGLMDDFDFVLDQMLNTKGLIIDVRKNNGGKLENVNKIVGRFISQPMTNLKAYRKNNIPIEMDPILPITNKTLYNKPVVVLINGSTLSSGELFAEYMRQLNFVTLIGDTTNGAACSDNYEEIEGDYILPSGRYIKIGNSFVLRYDGIPIEWNGIPPDILVRQTKADINAGRDKQLEHAIELF
ncbi:MAG: S41 family peptidase [Bacteroidota bacterium]